MAINTFKRKKSQTALLYTSRKKKVENIAWLVNSCPVYAIPRLEAGKPHSRSSLTTQKVKGQPG